MTIKKPMKPAAPVAEEVPEMTAAQGGATIADRFKLDAPAEAPKKASGGIATTIALLAALAALATVGILTFIIYQHYEFLKGA